MRAIAIRGLHIEGGAPDGQKEKKRREKERGAERTTLAGGNVLAKATKIMYSTVLGMF